MITRPRIATIISGAQRATLSRDPELGAGNLIHRLVVQDRVVDEPLLWTKPEWRSPFGGSYPEFSLLDLKREADRCAAWYHGLGVRPRDPVAIKSDLPIDHLVHYLGLTGLGAVPLLVNGRLDADATAELLRRVGVVGAFTAPEHLADTAARLGGELRFVTDGRGAAAGGPLPGWYPFVHDAGDPVLITHTSGTTDRPKAVSMSHESFIAGQRHRLRLPLPEGGERMLSALPGSHNSSMSFLFFALLNGVQIEVLADQRPETILDEIEAFRPSLVVGFFKVFADLAEQDLQRRDLSSVKLWYNSGDAAHESHIQKLVAVGSHFWADRDGVRRTEGSMFVDALGSSEMGHNLFFHLHRPGLTRYGRCVGKPFQFVRATILTEDGEELPPGEIGRLAVKSPTLTPAYWNDSNQLWQARIRGWFFTGDMAYRDASGSFYQVDRITDVVSTPEGPLYSVQAEELLLAEHPELMECTIVGLPGDAGVEPTAFLQVRGGGAFDRDAWRERLAATLTRNGIPAVPRVYLVEAGQLPVGVTGKVRKAKLRQQWRELVAESA